MSLALVGKYHNVRAPGEPGVRYVKHLYCGGGGIVVHVGGGVGGGTCWWGYSFLNFPVK